MTFVRGVFQALAVALGTLTIVFFAIRIVPGDPLDVLLGEDGSSYTTEAARTELARKLGLDQPALPAFASFLSRAAQGDFGQSLTKQKPVNELIAERLPSTALLALVAAVFANLTALPLGALAARSSLLSRGLLWATSITQSLPSFWLGPLLIAAFSLGWPGLPVSGHDSPFSLILPAATLGLGLLGVLSRTTQEAVSQCLHSDYVRTARGKGASEARVLFRHVLPNALPPIATVSSLQLAHLFAGAIITETIFDWPGLGTLLHESLMSRDYPTVQGIVVLIALTYAALNTLSDQVGRRA